MSFLKKKFKKSASPLVMAYIGTDDPHRGDSKASIGLSKLVAEMLNGRYVYVDQAMLNQNFPTIPNIREQLRRFCEQSGHPDVVIGTYSGGIRYSHEVKDAFPKKPALFINHINETLSKKRGSNPELVTHHLTTETLTQAGEEFKSHYPALKRPLVAVMMGGWIYHPQHTKPLAQKLIAVARHYPEITFFICPSRRTEQADRDLIAVMEEEIKNAGLTGRVHIRSTGYKTAIAGYNPYLGLLATADHIVVAGHSLSLVSEALFTGKNIYLHHPGTDYKKLESDGYIVPIKTLDDSRPFPTKPMKTLNLTEEVARSIVKDYHRAGSPFWKIVNKIRRPHLYY